MPWGLGWLIFGAREFLNTDVMLAGIAVIGIIGIVLEKLVFQRIEEFTVVRWGMVTHEAAAASACDRSAAAALTAARGRAVCTRRSRAADIFRQC